MSGITHTERARYPKNSIFKKKEKIFGLPMNKTDGWQA